MLVYIRSRKCGKLLGEAQRRRRPSKQPSLGRLLASVIDIFKVDSLNDLMSRVVTRTHISGLEVAVVGENFVSFQFGISSSLMFNEGTAVCGVNDTEHLRKVKHADRSLCVCPNEAINNIPLQDLCFLRSGHSYDKKAKPLFLSMTLFDPQCPENLGIR